MFIFKFKGEYLVKTPYWNTGTWTKKRSEATRYKSSSAMDIKKYYPQFTMIKLKVDK